MSVHESIATTATTSIVVKRADQARGWRRRWHETEREVDDLLAPSTDPLSADSIHAARHRLHSFYLQTYHLKDALNEEHASTGVPINTVETTITNDPDLALLADLANLDKHGKLDRLPRSGHAPVITSVEGTSLGLPTATWRLHLAIQHAGRSLDGLQVTRAAVEAWRRALAGWGLI